jgi:probable rRNA maturation factor
VSDVPGDSPIILILNRQEAAVDEEGLSQLAAWCLLGEGVGPAAELSVSFVRSDEMAELHERYMGEPGPTDVLSFAMDEEEGEDGKRLLGDVIIAPEVAAENNPDIEAELRLLLVHGILHLLGHDHQEEEQKARMWQRQALYVKTVQS